MMDAPTKSTGPVVIDGLEFPFPDYPEQGSAIEVADGIFWVSTPVPFVGLKQVNLWLIRDGDSRNWREAIGVPSTRCDGLGCVIPWNDMIVAIGQRPEALADDCERADIVISGAPVLSCEGPRLILDTRSIAASGGYAVTLSPLRAVSINHWRGRRPWVIY